MKLKYAVVYERLPNNFGAYVPDLPGCVSTGETWEEMQWMIREAIEFHIEGTVEDGDPLLEPRMSVTDAMANYVETIDDARESVLEWGFTLEESNYDAEVTFGMVEVEVSLPQPAAGLSGHRAGGA